MNFGVLLQNRTYVCCNILSCLPTFTETDLFVCMYFFSNSDHVMFTWRIQGWAQGAPAALPPPLCGLLNISALHFQLGIQPFVNFKRPELQSQKFSRRSMSRNSLEKCAVGSPILPLYTISVGPLHHKILRPPVFNPGLSQFLSAVFVALEHATRVYKILLSQ